MDLHCNFLYCNVLSSGFKLVLCINFPINFFLLKRFWAKEAAALFSTTSSSWAHWFQFSSVAIPLSITIGKKVTANRNQYFWKQPSSCSAPLSTPASQLKRKFRVDCKTAIIKTCSGGLSFETELHVESYLIWKSFFHWFM